MCISHERVGVGPQHGGALHIEVHEYVLPPGEAGEYFFFQRAVMTPKHTGMLEEGAGLDALKKVFLGEKMVIASVFLAWANRAGGSGDAVVGAFGGAGGAAQGGFAAAGWSGDDAEETGEKRWIHSMFWTCSRSFSTAPFPATTRWARPASLALLPMVLNSRWSS